MSEQTMKILRMLEEGKLTVDEASELLAKVQDLEEEASKPEPEPGARHRPDMHFEMPNIPKIPNMPPIPDVGRIVNEAMAEAFRGVRHFGGSVGQESEPVGPMRYKGARFSGAQLEHTDLTDAKMDNRTRFEGADLRFASFVDADLRGADLRGADLSYSDFTDAKFNGADLRGAKLSRGTYIDADFRDADLHGADLSMSDLTDANFKHVKEPGLVLRGVTMVGLKYYSTEEDVEEATEGAVSERAEEVFPEPEAPPEAYESGSRATEGAWDEEELTST